jgi:aminoglycoside phosphotransferase (APT) family kinase protein
MPAPRRRCGWSTRMTMISQVVVDTEHLSEYLSGVPGVREALPIRNVQRVGQGQSNLTFRVDLHGGAVVLRRPPSGPLPPRAHDVLREFRVMRALRQSSVPVPRMLAACADVSVIGAPFILMEALPGDALRFVLPNFLADDAPRRWRGLIGEQLVAALAALHTTDPAAVGLADLGRPTGYLSRQLKRWREQLEYSRVRPTDDLDWTVIWLEQHQPGEPHAPTIVHGDYKLDNAIFAHDGPPRLLGIVDWEMATIGDPLADLGWLLAFWCEARNPVPELKILPRVTAFAGFSSHADIVQRYAERTNRPVPEQLPYYIVFALWKMAVLLEGHWARHVRGTAADFGFAYLEDAGQIFWQRIRHTAEHAFEENGR